MSNHESIQNTVENEDNSSENIHVESESSIDAGPVMVNDAEIIGDMFQHVLDLPMVIGFGHNRDAKAWPAQKITFLDLLTTLTSHPVGPKDGRAFLQGSAAGNIRKKMSIDALYIMGLDVDCGISMDLALAKIAECKLAAIVYTTNSHMGTDTFVLEGSYNQFCKKHKLSQDGVDRDSMVRFLVEERKWLPEVANTIELPEDGATHPEEGKGYNLTHAPIPKFRIVFPLDAPFVIAKQTISQADALDLWRRKLLGLAKSLELPIDISCTDPSRLFYFPRHKMGAPFRTVVLSGEALAFESVVAVPGRGDAPVDDNAFRDAAKGLGAGGAEFMVGDFSLKRWAAQRAKSFDIVRMFRDVAPGKIRNDQNTDKIEIECPFDAYHSNAGDTSDRACWIESANADGSGRGFGFGCQHNGCKERDRLEFIAQACDNGWFTTDDLESETFTVFGLDDQEETAEQGLARLAKVIDDSFTTNTTRTELDSLLEQLASFEASPSQCDAIIDHAIDKMGVTKPRERSKLAGRFTPILKAADKKRQGQKRAAAKGEALADEIDGKPMLAPRTHGYMPCVKRAFERLMVINEASPTYFSMGGQKLAVNKDAHDNIRSIPLGKDEMLSELDHECAWVELRDGTPLSIECPSRIATNIITYRGHEFPNLIRITPVPFFTASGELVVKEGYHADSEIYYAPPPGFVVPPIPDDPTDEEVAGAVLFINDNLLRDFPFNDGAKGGESSRANANAFLLERFVRELIDGYVPIYMYNKTQPGAGGSLIVDVSTAVVLGEPAPPQVEKESDGEQRKSMTSFLLGGGEFNRLDNLNKKHAGAVMALASTLDNWEDRKLGVSENVNIPIRNSWVIAGNKIKASTEISRRIVPIRLATKGDPRKRDGFKHKPLLPWVIKNRPALVAACLTIIQAWVKRGKPAWSKAETSELVSYESYVATMGGILEVAKIPGFLGNLELARAVADEDNLIEREFYTAWMLRHGESIRANTNPDGEIHLKSSQKESLVSLVIDNELGFPLDRDKDGAQQARQLGYWLVDHADVVIELAPGFDAALEIISPDDPRNKRAKANLYRVICVGYDPERATRRTLRLRAAMTNWMQGAADFDAFVDGHTGRMWE